MFTIISSTNRKNSSTAILAKHCHQFIKGKTEEQVNLLPLEDIPIEVFANTMYNKDTLAQEFIEIEDNLLIPAQKLLFIVPEYNGSYPGILKLFIDACSIRSKMAIFKGKKAALIGVATGRAGNLRGLDHLCSVLMFMGVQVFPSMLPISVFNRLLDEEKNISDEATLKVLEQTIDGFLKW